MGIALSHRRADGARRHSVASGRRVGVATLAAVLLASACLTATADADVGEKIIERCTHGQSLSGFSQQAYRRALQELPTEVEEYSDCGNLIRHAQLSAAGGQGGSSGGGGAPAVATPLSRSARRAVKPLGARDVGAATAPQLCAAGPVPLLGTLGFLLACALALGGRGMGRSVRAR